jgi:hypothetical protein
MEISEIVTSILARVDAGLPVAPVLSLPWPWLEEPIGRWLYRGGLFHGIHVVVGGPQSGKTAFAIELAEHAARTGSAVLYFCNGHNGWETQQRMRDAMKADRLRADAMGTDPLPVRCVEATPWDIEIMFDYMKDLVDMHPECQDPPLLVVDSADPIKDTERMAWCLRRCAKQLGAVVLLLATSDWRETGDPADLLNAGGDVLDGFGTPDVVFGITETSISTAMRD